MRALGTLMFALGLGALGLALAPRAAADEWNKKTVVTPVVAVTPQQKEIDIAPVVTPQKPAESAAPVVQAKGRMKEPPQTASDLPRLGALGMLLAGAGLSLRALVGTVA